MDTSAAEGTTDDVDTTDQEKTPRKKNVDMTNLEKTPENNRVETTGLDESDVDTTGLERNRGLKICISQVWKNHYKKVRWHPLLPLTRMEYQFWGKCQTG